MKHPRLQVDVFVLNVLFPNHTGFLRPGPVGCVLLYYVVAVFSFVMYDGCLTRAMLVPAAAMMACALCKMCFKM